jgi:membrane protein DedA with SNARE-associated domain
MGLGFATATLFTAGLVKISFKKYMLLNFLGQIIWTGLLLSIGYIFGEWYDAIDNVFGKITLISGILIVVVLFFGYGRYVKKRMTQKHS